MEAKELLFTPKKQSMFKKNPLLGVSLFTKIFFLCGEFLAKISDSESNIAYTDRYIERFWRLNFETCFAKLFVSGREYLSPKTSYVYMSNHESWMDIPAMFGAVPGSLRMVSKIGLMQVPIVGHAMVSGGFIAVDRKNRSRAIKQLENAKKQLREGISIWISPEGTRSRDGSLGPFKKGGFHLARDLGCPIVPVYIEGAQEVMPSDGLTVYTNRSITVHFCPPISTDNYDRAHTIELIERVRKAILDKKKECEIKI
jgi:1-acyl-sn-glycerol-3-phosphate acyltransferase